MKYLIPSLMLLGYVVFAIQTLRSVENPKYHFELNPPTNLRARVLND